MPDVVVNTLNRLYIDSDLRDIPSVFGADIKIHSRYNMNFDIYQDTIMLLGHADPDDGIFEPREVFNAQETINYLGADSSSPLVRALLELVDAGCNNVWVYPVAPMSEYVAATNLEDRFETHSEWNGDTDDVAIGEFPSLSTVTLDWSDNNFYQRYYNRLHVAYSRLNVWGSLSGIGIMIPVEAVFYDAGDVDFLGQLIDFCHTYFTANGSVVLSVLGTRIQDFTQHSINEMVSDSRLDPNTSVYPEFGKYVMIAIGEGIINHKATSLSHNSALAVQVAANLATQDMGRSIAGLKLPGCVNLSRIDLTTEQSSMLAKAKLNPLIRTAKGRRGFSYEIKLLTDNTLSGFPEEAAQFNGDSNMQFWSMYQMHMVAAVINQVVQYGEELIGESLSGSENFQSAVENMMMSLRSNNYIRDFSLNIEQITNEYKLVVRIGIAPHFGLRQIAFQVEVGP